jgi:hypothetical protein
MGALVVVTVAVEVVTGAISPGRLGDVPVNRSDGDINSGYNGALRVGHEALYHPSVQLGIEGCRPGKQQGQQNPSNCHNCLPAKYAKLR